MTSKTGIWIAGAKGDIAATMMVGTLAMKSNLVSSNGLTTALPPMSLLPLVGLDELVFGGIDISDRPLADSARSLYSSSRTISHEVLEAVLPEIEQIEQDILIDRHMTWKPRSPRDDALTVAEHIARIKSAIKDFRSKHDLDRVVVVNLTSVEPDPLPSPGHETLQGLEQLIADNDKGALTPGLCYAYAALDSGCAYLNFTPNAGIFQTAIDELASSRGLPYYGSDGKTGETLVKTALAPMFAWRNLRVLSWEGTNMLGNNDGRALDDGDNKIAKLRNKSGVLSDILGYEPHAGIDINYVPSLGDWKTAWDLIHFQGFLDVNMSMQFTWQGCDSILAAPLVLDMVRMADFACRENESGAMHHLAAFFKNPLGVEEMALHSQFQRLLDYTAAHLESNQSLDRTLDKAH